MNNQQIILITGTRKGIGKFLAEYYLDHDYTVIGCSRKTCDINHDKFISYQIDVTDEKEVKILFSNIRKSFNRLDILINNAGIAAMNHALMTPISMVKKVLSTNITGTFLFCREAAKLMKKNNFGRIVNFSSIATVMKLEGECIYSASKAAINNLTEILAFEFAPYGITINSIAPTPIKTDLIKHIPEDKIISILNRQAIKRHGEFQDIVNVINFYISPNSSFITGQILYLGGVS